MNAHQQTTTTLDESLNAGEVFEELLDHREALREHEENKRGNIIPFSSYIHKCPRCESKVRISGKHPYCPDCNWDSLTDPSMEGPLCAA